MRLYSTHESVEAGEVSLLAIVETIAVTAFLVYIAIWKHSLFFAALTAVTAPTLLLRTEESKEHGLVSFLLLCTGIVRLRAYKKSFQLFDYRYWPVFNDWHSSYEITRGSVAKSIKEAISGMIAIIRALILIILFSLVSKIYSTIVYLWLDPVSSFRAIPRNWRRISFSIDLTCPPELVLNQA
jgi:hypothetical protein